MKKTLVIFLALAMVCSVFAEEPAAEVKVAEFSGDAALTFGINLNAKTDKGDDTVKTGFKNETSVKLKLNLLNKGEKSTEGDGIWGELVVNTKGASVESGDPAKLALKAEVDKAVLHFGPMYMGIKSGDLAYGGDFYYPNALNYKDDDDGDLVRKPSAGLDYDQGFVLGYKHNMFKVEASVRTKKDAVDKTVAVVATPTTTTSEKGKKYYAIGPDGKIVEKIGDGKKTIAALFKGNVLPSYYTKEGGDETFWTNKYAMGIYGEVTPIKDLRVGAGFAYVLGDLTKDAGNGPAGITQNGDNARDMTVFAGADYRLGIGEAFLIQPTVTYTLYNDYVWTAYDKGSYEKNGANAVNMLNAGLRFGFAKCESSSGNSLLYDFFGDNALYTDRQEDKDNGDDILLPGISVAASFNLKEKAMERKLPIMATFYSGSIVKGLNVAALYGANVAKDASKVLETENYYTGLSLPAALEAALAGAAPVAAEKSYTAIIGERGVQAGVAVSYDIPVGDITITPAAGVLWTHGSLKGKYSTKIVANQIKTEAKVDVKNLIKNTTLSVFWDGAAFGKAKSDEVKVSGTTVKAAETYSETKKGLIGIKAKIAL